MSAIIEEKIPFSISEEDINRSWSAPDQKESKLKAKSDSQLFYILANMKGICPKTMLSILIPSYGSIDGIKVELKKLLDYTKSKYETALSFAQMSIADDDEDGIDDDDSLMSYRHQCLCLKEAAAFLTGIKWQEDDIKGDDALGMILFYGYIEDAEKRKKGGTINGKKVFHTFPCPKGFVDEAKIYQGRRFDLSLLNKNPWCVEIFGQF